MKKKTQFQSENIMMSVLGHLVLLAVLMMSFSVVVERAKLVTPNRIEIIEIDLKNVRVSGDETKLYNTSRLTRTSFFLRGAGLSSCCSSSVFGVFSLDDFLLSSSIISGCFWSIFSS